MFAAGQRIVAGEFGFDSGIVDRIDPRELGDQMPAQIGVELQPIGHLFTSQPGGQQLATGRR